MENAASALSNFDISGWLRLYSAELIFVGTLLSTFSAFLLKIEFLIPKGEVYREKVNKLMRELNMKQREAEKRVNKKIKWVKRVYYILICVGGMLVAIGTYLRVI